MQPMEIEELQELERYHETELKKKHEILAEFSAEIELFRRVCQLKLVSPRTLVPAPL